ncbi:hypothetical protein AUEXF2481DRAFT_505411 [Aureobasidium subglaciale EXF-2481]|uniref:Knr4/Smi1-like domain-containing protein n=1 Tax=Aureobasidium subglaciale (strain EXF-2481) TaxID=1043005 RepID=A0A074YWK4_AURSE|nr:uncharacterized protein AUEXF2481DRAFT_505411 [Aureobasidium subglaciale EXF-2481]KEQ91246.1 hypothetical protein AUEXF2481DRAFT_505411 [Aureobasidium subglaciale EXF-2481]
MARPPYLFVQPSHILAIRSIPAVENCIVDMALRFVMLGRIYTARQFIELLHSRPLLQTLDLAGLRALVPFWRLSAFPTGIPQYMRTDAYFREYIKDKEEQGLQWPVYVKQEQRTENEAGIAAILSPEHDIPHYYKTSGARVALEIAVKLAEERGIDPIVDSKVQEILGKLTENYSHEDRDLDLIDSPRCWSLFTSGAVAKKWDLSDQKLDAQAADLLEAARQRYWREPSSSSPASISELLRSCNDDSVARSDEYWIEAGEEKPQSLYSPPATEEDIANLEARLKVNLPEDFKEFLRTSNGFGGIWNGYGPDPPILSTDEIDWFESREYETEYCQLELPSSVTELRDTLAYKDDDLDPPLFEDVIRIASYDIDDLWLVPPELMQRTREHYKKLYAVVDDNGKRTIERAIDNFAGSWEDWEKLDWGCVYCARGGGNGWGIYKSFKAWLEDSAFSARNDGQVP